MFCLGIAAFAMFFLGDFNDWRLKNRLLRSCFYLGVVMLAASTVGLCIKQDSTPLSARYRVPFLVLALFFGLFTLYSVLSVSFVNRGNGEKRVFSGGLYAVCRHPGFLFFVPMYICLWLGAGLPFVAAAVFIGLNLLLVLFEDKLVFPAFLQGYSEYKTTTPFIVPNAKSIIRAAGNNSKGGTI